MSEIESSIPQARGPADHNVRDQIVVAAEAHFSHYGYEKTTVSDLATPTEKFRRMFKTLVATEVSLVFNDRKLYDIAAHSAGEGWPSAQAYCERIRQILTEVIREGRESGEFERKTPLDETVHVIDLVMKPYVNPLLLQYNLDVVEEAPAQLSNLVLRSLAP